MTNETKIVEPTLLRGLKPTHPGASEVVALLRDLTRGYTRHHKDLVVHGVRMTGSIALSVQGNKDDHGRLVGSEGNNIRGLQTIFTRIGRKMGTPVRLTLIPPVRGVQAAKLKPFAVNSHFKHDATTALLQRTINFCFALPYDLAVADVGENTEYEIKPNETELPVIRGDLARALHNIFHAIGKTRGRIIHVNLDDPDGDNVIELEAMHERALREQEREL